MSTHNDAGGLGEVEAEAGALDAAQHDRHAFLLLEAANHLRPLLRRQPAVKQHIANRLQLLKREGKEIKKKEKKEKNPEKPKFTAMRQGVKQNIL